MPTYLSSLDTMSFISLFLDSINSPLTALNGLSTLFHFNFKLIYIVYTIFKFQQSYSTLWYSIMKTFAMTLGELNYEDTFIPSDKLNYPTAMNVLFLLFCLGMPIILMNMLVSNWIGHQTRGCTAHIDMCLGWSSGGDFPEKWAGVLGEKFWKWP